MPERSVNKLGLVAASLALILAGCPGNGNGRAEVSGKVTLDGRPVNQGSISFIPVKGTSGPVAGGAIVQGEYHLADTAGPVAGEYRVEVRANRKTGRRVRGTDFGDDALVDEVVEAVPARYNTASQLERQIKHGKNTDVNFDLTTRN